MKFPNRVQISIIILCCCLNALDTIAQTIRVRASDGEYARHVLITWNRTDDAASYRVLRSVQNIPEDRKVIADWQTKAAPIWMDAEAKPGMKYYYSVEVLYHSGKKIMSKSDIGYREAMTDMATEEELLSYEEVMANPQREVSLKDTVLMSRPEIIVTSKPRKELNIRIVLYNIGVQHVKNASISYYLSEDDLWDTEDTFLIEKEAIDIMGRADPIVVEQNEKAPDTTAKYLIAILKHQNEIKAVTHTLIR